MKKNGYVQIYTGTGKGKTTAAFGLALRAAGRRKKVRIFQFLKPKNNISGELVVAEVLKDYIQIIRNDQVHPIFSGEKETGILSENAEKMFLEAEETVKSGEVDLVILDEINNCVHGGIFSKEKILKLIKEKPAHVELVLTGRNAAKELIEAADLVTEMKMIKHTYEKGIPAREGIEY
jgi:cob(I)alamin adenosyltransferase